MHYFHRSRISHWQLKLILALLKLTVLLIAPGSILGWTRDSRVDEIDLSGISAPYSFHTFCRLADELWAVGGNGTVQHTDKNGTNQQQITNKSLSGVFFVRSEVGWVVGDDGLILHSEDRGLNWETQVTNVTENIHAIACVAERICLAVGDNGLILRTLDKGRHWEKVRSDTPSSLFAVSFVNNQAAWVVGADGLILHTADGGLSWVKQSAGIVLFPDGPFAGLADLRAVRFFDEKRGWVAGTGGVARTGDGGKTWDVKQVGDGAFIGLVTNDAVVVWAIESNGRNYVTKDGGSNWTSVRFKDSREYIE